jgi:pimeloyl-ACP methyl ester carboxylesterase
VRFVLVHGGFHGAWCWNKVAPRLTALGHDAVAIDLPGHGERVKDKATIDSWRAAMADVLLEGDVLVGHSMGGYVIALAADEAPEKVGRLIYLAAPPPVEGQSMTGATSLEDAFTETMGVPLERYTAVVEIPEQGACIALTDPEAANKLFYHDCSPEDQAWAFAHLTPQPLEPITTPLHLPRYWAASIPRNYVFCTDDHSHPVVMDNQFMKQLGLISCVGITTSHSPFLSQPAELAKLLDACARGTLD